MPTWNPSQYLKFAEARTRPCRDLAAQIDLDTPLTVIDLGCGPGNSSQVLAERWPDAEIVGLDNSAGMIEAARNAHPERQWIEGNIAEWAAASGPRFDAIFSNAALQWVPHHEVVFPKLMARVAEGGVLAVQIPGNYDAAQHRLLRQLAASASWRRWFPDGQIREWHTHDIEFYYDALSPLAAHLDAWATEYLHVMPDVEGIVEWYKGTGLRPYLDAIGDEDERRRFLKEYAEALRPHFAPRADGNVLFPFRRIFIVAYK